MNRTFRLYLGILGAVILTLVLLELNKTEIINWNKNFELDSKSPFGLYVFDQEADGLMNQKLTRVDTTPYEYFLADSTQPPQNILLINRYVTEEGWIKILNRVEKGDQVFVFSYRPNNYLMNELELVVDGQYYLDSKELELSDTKFKKERVWINEYPGEYYINGTNHKSKRILGIDVTDGGKERANFVEVSLGEGKIYLHTEPMVLTNYYLLNDDDYKYAEHIFSYLPDRNTIWFQNSTDYVNTSPLRYILGEKSLKYLWYLSIISLLLFAVFHAKRRQRVVPIIEPYKNSSVEFVKTIGNLYLQEGDNKDMAHKKAVYFLNKVRGDLLIDTKKLDKHFEHLLQLKTGAKPDKVERLIVLLEKALHPEAPVQEEELLELNRLIDKIYNK